jgi:signal transduction histidine kinase
MALLAVCVVGRPAVIGAQRLPEWLVLLCGGLVSAFGAVLVARLAHTRMNRRLARLGDAVERLGRGELSVRIEDLAHQDGIGALARTVATFRDQTAARASTDEAAAALGARVAERRRGAETELARTGRTLAVGEFAALIAHEVRQPISAILLNCAAANNYLSRDSIRLGEARAAVQRIRRDAERAGAVIEGIRAMLSHTPPTAVTLDLALVLEEALSFAGEELRRAEITLVTEFSPQVPMVSVDRGQLQQVVLNLVANAVEAMKTTAPAERVLTIRTDRQGDGGVVVTVRDTGVGVDPKAIDRLFDPLFTTRSGGIGLGLSISRSIIEAHGGRLWATSGGPRGACFCFTLPGAAAGDASGRPSSTPVADMVPLPARRRVGRRVRAA